MINETMYALGSAPSCIRELFEYGKKRAEVIGAENVMDMTLGNPSVPAPRAVNEAIRELLETEPSLAVHGYTSAAGDFSARKAIADDLNARFDAGASPEELFLGCGAAPELAAVFRALSGRQAELVVIAPYFPEYKPLAEAAGLTFRLVEADRPHFQIDFDALEALIGEHTTAVLINSPNNPSGVVYTRETLQRLSDLLTAKSAAFGHPIYLISDEPYRELAYGVEVPFVPNIYPNTVVCYSYSKSLSLPGERIGYVYVPKQAVQSKKLYAAVAGAARINGHVCAPSLIQKVIARCASLRPELYPYEVNRLALYNALVRSGYEVAKPDGAFYLFVKSPGGDAKAFSEKAKAKDLLIVPGDDFGCPDYFRICYCVDPLTIFKAIPVFEELIK